MLGGSGVLGLLGGDQVARLGDVEVIQSLVHVTGLEGRAIEEDGRGRIGHIVILKDLTDRGVAGDLSGCTVAVGTDFDTDDFHNIFSFFT